MYTAPSCSSVLTSSLWKSCRTAALVLLVALALFESLFRLCRRGLVPPSLFPLLSSADSALVTGGLRGLGLALVQLLLDSTNIGQVYVLDVLEPPASLVDSVCFVPCDLSAPESLDQAIRSVYENIGDTRIAVVVNNAGVRDSGALLNMSASAVRRVFEVNTFSVITILQQVVSRHIKRDALQPFSIVNVSSVLGAFGPKHLLVYSASKAAAIQIHEVFVEELRPFPLIRPLLVVPGQLNTEMFLEVVPNHQFFAPLVDHQQLAREIVRKVVRGEAGVMCEPLYANFLPVMKIMPMVIQRLARWASQMDDKVKE